MPRKPKAKGPRATGVVELAPNGKAHLIPITIMVDGKFYDASAYKADPVPFALGSEVVYEALKTGVPQGEFTVTGALQAQDAWFGEGKWVAESAKPKKKHLVEAKPNLDDDAGPPTLRRAEGSKSSDSSSSGAPSLGKASSPPASNSPAPANTPSVSADSSHTGDDHASTDSPAAQPSKPAEDSSAAANDEDPNRPSLRRGKQPATVSTASATSTTAIPPAAKSPGAGTKSPAAAKPKDAPKTAGAIQLLPAVSDASGPEPRPYSFEMKPDEEQSYRKKLFALASAEVVAKAKQMTPVMPSAAPPKRTPAKTAAKPIQPAFDNVQIRAFDLSNTNEPVFVMSADAHLPATNASQPGSKPAYFITLVAKADIYLDLHKMLAQVTDDHHLDEFPRFELIDAVDADGDGRGELLFREVSDAGTAWAVYRAAADQLYPLFEGKPQQPHPLPTSAP